MSCNVIYCAVIRILRSCNVLSCSVMPCIEMSPTKSQRKRQVTWTDPDRKRPPQAIPSPTARAALGDVPTARQMPGMADGCVHEFGGVVFGSPYTQDHSVLGS